MINIAFRLILISALFLKSTLSYGIDREPENVLPEHQICQKDEHCIVFALKCSCDCGVGINKTFLSLYSEAKEKRCEYYSGKMCKMQCEGTAKCVSFKCKAIRNK